MISATPENAACFSALELCDVGRKDESLVALRNAVVPEMIETKGDDHAIGVRHFAITIAVDFFDAFREFPEAAGDGFEMTDGFNDDVELQPSFATDLGAVPSDIPSFFNFFSFRSGEVFGDFAHESEGGVPEVVIPIGIHGRVSGLGLVVGELHDGLVLGAITIPLQARPKL